MAADIDSTNRGFEMWSGTSKGARSVKGKVVTTTGLSQNFRIYFDGDLQDELMDATGSPTVENGGATGGKIDKYNSGKKTLDRLFSFYNVEGASLNNWTKANPCIVADLFGDWREEFIVRSASDPSKVIVFTTPFTSPYRVYTLMHDSHYRVSIAWQNVAYNQPPHLGYYLPDMVKSLKQPSISVVGEVSNPIDTTPAVMSLTLLLRRRAKVLPKRQMQGSSRTATTTLPIRLRATAPGKSSRRRPARRLSRFASRTAVPIPATWR